jgi:hypothetical protein
MIRRISKLLGVWVALSFGQPQQGQVVPPPQVWVEAEIPKEVREHLELRRKLLKEQKRRELKKLRRQEKFENIQNNLSLLQHQKSIMLERKRIELLKRMPPVFYSVEISGVVGDYAISKSGIVIGKGYRVGTAEVSEISIKKGVLLKDGQVVYPADSTGVKIVFNELYEEAKQTQAAPPPPPNIFSSPPAISIPPVPPPPPPR